MRPVALAFRIIALALIVLGIVRITGIFTAEPSWRSLLFYTVQSNLLGLVWMALLAAATLRDLRTLGRRGHSTPSARWSAAVMMAITVTMLVYLFVLVPSSFVQGSNYEPFSLTDNLIHIIAPSLLILDWLIFVPKGRLLKSDPLRWVIIPFAYLIFALIYGGLGGTFLEGNHYPYPFLNVEEHGVGGVAAWIAGLTVALVGVGYLYYGLDRLLSRMSPRSLR